MGKTRAFFKKIGDIKGIFHSRMGTIKGRNHMDLREAEEVARTHIRTIKNSLNDLDNHDNVVSYLKPDILVSDV